MGMASIKMYDKFGQILRIETTAKDISFFKHYRKVEQRNGESVMKFAPMKKTIYSLGALREVLGAANRRYLEFLSAIDDPSNGIDKLNKITRTVHEEARSYRGFNFFDQDDEALFLALARGEFTISAKQSAACSVPPIQQRANVQNPTQAAHARAHQKSEPLLQVLPVGARQTGRRPGPQTQGTGHHSGTCR
jgi:hypothetical protein